MKTILKPAPGPRHNSGKSRKPQAVHLTSAHDSSDVRIFHKECQSLARAGYEVTVIANEQTNTTQGCVRILGVGTCGNRLQRVTSKMLLMMREAFRLNADVYHIHDPDLLPLGLLLRASGKSVVYDIHEDLPRTIAYKHYIPSFLRAPLVRLVESMENAAARAMSGLVAATPAIAERFRKFHSNVAVVSNYPMLSELLNEDPKDWRERRRSVAYVGGIAAERGIHELLAAMDRLPAGDTTLELAGWYSDPRMEPELMKREIWSKVNWHGQLGRAGVTKLLSSVRAGLVVLRPEQNFIVSLPTKLFEYMAAGLPVIASDFPLWRNIVAGTGCGLLVDPEDTSAIATAISYLLSHDAEAEAMGKRGRAAVEAKYSWEAEERTLIQFYVSLANPGPERQAVLDVSVELEDLPYGEVGNKHVEI
jgi:glycosyltransferase involved in cell wall biosynthesis